MLYNPYAQWIFRLLTFLGFRRDALPATFVTETDLRSLLRLAGLELVRVRPPVFLQTGRGKNDVVRLRFSKATGDLLTIRDADLTMPPNNCLDFMMRGARATATSSTATDWFIP